MRRLLRVWRYVESSYVSHCVCARVLPQRMQALC